MIDNSDRNCKVLPKALLTCFVTLLPQLDLFTSVLKLSLSLKEDRNGQILVESCPVEVAEDLSEKEMSDEDQSLHDIEDLGCEKFLEPQIMIQ